MPQVGMSIQSMGPSVACRACSSQVAVMREAETPSMAQEFRNRGAAFGWGLMIAWMGAPCAGLALREPGQLDRRRACIRLGDVGATVVTPHAMAKTSADSAGT